MIQKVFTYTGKGVSLNKFYSQGHWGSRSGIKNKYKEEFLKMIGSSLHYMEKFSVAIYFNSRHDTDNVVGMCKIFVDTIKGDCIPDDNKKYFRGCMIFPDESLPTNTFKFVITDLSQGDYKPNMIWEKQETN